MSALARARPETCLSDLVLDRIVAGELDRAGQPHLATCEACSARLAALERDVQELPERIFVAGEAVKVRRRLPRVMAGIATVLAAAAALAVVSRSSIEQELTERTKGGLGFTVHAKRASGEVDQLLPGAKLLPGESVRFSLSLEREGHVAVIGIDAAGVVTEYARPAGALAAGKDRLLDGSVVLDDTLGFERLVAVSCPGPVDAAALLASARSALAAAKGDPSKVGALDTTCRQATLLIEKVAAR